MSRGEAGRVTARAAPPEPPPGTPRLREMRWWDIGAVVGLEQQLFPQDAWSAGMFWSELAHARGPRATRRYLVAEAPAAAGDRHPPEGGLAGYGGLSAVDGTGDIQTIGVLPDHEGTGLGARLLTALLTAAETEFGCRTVMLEVRVDNHRARRLYERFGFETIGVRRGYYQPGNVDAYVMRRFRGADAPPHAPSDAETPDAETPDAETPDAETPDAHDETQGTTHG